MGTALGDLQACSWQKIQRHGRTCTCHPSGICRLKSFGRGMQLVFQNAPMWVLEAISPPRRHRIPYLYIYHTFFCLFFDLISAPFPAPVSASWTVFTTFLIYSGFTGHIPFATSSSGVGVLPLIVTNRVHRPTLQHKLNSSGFGARLHKRSTGG